MVGRWVVCVCLSSSEQLVREQHGPGSAHPELLMALSDYAEVLTRFSRVREAQHLFEEALVIARALYPRRDDTALSTVMNNLALLLLQRVRCGGHRTLPFPIIFSRRPCLFLALRYSQWYHPPTLRYSPLLAVVALSPALRATCAVLCVRRTKPRRLKSCTLRARTWCAACTATGTTWR